MCRYRDAQFNRVLAPEGEILSFASPKESIQRKGDPDAACFLRSGIFVGVCQKGRPCPFGKARHTGINRYLRNTSYQVKFKKQDHSTYYAMYYSFKKRTNYKLMTPNHNNLSGIVSA
jgi:hypothetical protein